MPNQVFLNKQDIIEIHVVGDQTPASIMEMGETASKLATRQRKRGKPVLVIDNLLQIGVVSPEGRQMVVHYGKIIDYDRLAMLGNNAMLRVGANLLLQAIGKGKQLHYFESEAAAVNWLLS